MTDKIIQSTKARMSELGISQYKLAQTLGMKESNLSRMLGGRSGTIPKNWQRVLEELGLELLAVPTKNPREQHHNEQQHEEKP